MKLGPNSSGGAVGFEIQEVMFWVLGIGIILGEGLWKGFLYSNKCGLILLGK